MTVHRDRALIPYRTCSDIRQMRRWAPLLMLRVLPQACLGLALLVHDYQLSQ